MLCALFCATWRIVGPDGFRAAIVCSLGVAIVTYAGLSPGLSLYSLRNEIDRDVLIAGHPRPFQRIAIAIQAGVFTTFAASLISLIQ